MGIEKHIEFNFYVTTSCGNAITSVITRKTTTLWALIFLKHYDIWQITTVSKKVQIATEF